MTQKVEPTDTTERTERVFRQRAERLRQRIDDGVDRAVAFEVALISVGSERIGIPALHLREIVPLPPLTRIPHAPAWLAGLVQLRGEIMSVVDLADWLNLPRSKPAAFLAIVSGDQGLLGLTADAVLGFRPVHADEISTAVVHADARHRPYSAITTDLCSLLDVDRLMADPRLLLEQD